MATLKNMGFPDLAAEQTEQPACSIARARAYRSSISTVVFVIENNPVGYRGPNSPDPAAILSEVARPRQCSRGRFGSKADIDPQVR
jgi:hypothetical protein